MPQLRADAQENRERILGAARALFAERGISVGMHEVARRADVGPATLYRRFPTKQDLVDEAFAVEMRLCREIILEGCADADAWRGLSSVIRELLALYAENRGFVEAFLASGPSAGRIVDHRRQLLRLLTELIGRARGSGAVRADFSVADLVLMLQAGRAVQLGSVGGRNEPPASVARRLADIMIDGVRAR